MQTNRRNNADKKENDTAFGRHLLSLPIDVLLEVFSHLEPESIRLIIQNDTSGKLKVDRRIEDYHCEEHGLKLNLGKT